MNIMELKEFLFKFDDIKSEEKKFCFILGAGASKSSGIPTGSDLTKIWFSELKGFLSETALNEWMTERKISEDDLAKSYPEIFSRRFFDDKGEGYAYLESLMAGKEPSCGYSVLAQVLAAGRHNIVITTNFDSLTEDALFIYTIKKPLMIGHESLANYIKAQSTRPIIVKIHHDLFLSPKNDLKETSTLAENFSSNLAKIFESYTPLVIGYGGNDGSLMGFIEGLKSIKGGIFWFCRNTNNLSPRVKDLIKKFNGSAVIIPGFDDLLMQMGDYYRYDRMDKEILSTAERRAKEYREQIGKITKQESTPTDTKEAVGKMVSKGKQDWFYYELKAAKEKDISKRDEVYRTGLLTCPDSAELHGNYAIFLKDIRKDYDAAEAMYKKAIELDPNDGDYFCNYANFLANIHKDYDTAEAMYKKAIELDPDHAIYISNYADFLTDIHKDYNAAEEMYKKANKLDPDNANNIGNYAKLELVQNHIDRAQNLIQISFKISQGEEIPLELELWFYRYAVFYKEFKTADREVEKLLSEGITSPGWYLDDVLKVAKERGHPDFDKLSDYAKRISELQ